MDVLMDWSLCKGVSEANWSKDQLIPQDSGSDGENCVFIEKGWSYRVVRTKRQGDVMSGLGPRFGLSAFSAR